MHIATYTKYWTDAEMNVGDVRGVKVYAHHIQFNEIGLFVHQPDYILRTIRK